MINPFKLRMESIRRLGELRKGAREKDKKEPLSPPLPADEAKSITCPKCERSIAKERLGRHLNVCPYCSHHMPLGAKARLLITADRDSLGYLFPPVFRDDPLNFPGYRQKLTETKFKTGLDDAVYCAEGAIDGQRAVLCALDSSFLMGSMGCYVGEAVTCAIEHAHKNCLPLIIFCASGGARMQEGIFSLMQMAKTSAALERLSRSGGLYIACLTHPTTGGVSASFAGLGDITLAEPDALIGFAGPRVIEQTIRQKLPDGFQRSEYLEQHGFVDRIVPRNKLRGELSLLLSLHRKGGGSPHDT